MPLDVALNWNQALGRADISLAGPDLLLDQGLRTAVIISLFTDRPALPGDAIPDGTTNRRGWWGNLPTAATPDVPKPILIGSRLWLLDRALQTMETLRAAESYALESLQWGLDRGVFGSVSARASYPRLSWIELDVDIVQAGSASTFNFAWNNS